VNGVLPGDLVTINRWRAARSMAPLRWEAVPKIGLIVPDLAAGFLFETESPIVAILDSFITNPDAPMRLRYKAVQEILAALGEKAKSLGIERLIGFSESNGIVRLAEGLGYSSRPSRLVYREVPA